MQRLSHQSRTTCTVHLCRSLKCQTPALDTSRGELMKPTLAPPCGRPLADPFGAARFPLIRGQSRRFPAVWFQMKPCGSAPLCSRITNQDAATTSVFTSVGVFLWASAVCLFFAAFIVSVSKNADLLPGLVTPDRSRMDPGTSEHAWKGIPKSDAKKLGSDVTLIPTH